jgi:hypothetical protein
MMENVDLSGIGGYINYSNFGSEAASLIVAVASFFFLLLLGYGLYILLTGTRSHKYKERIADMFVVGKLKQMAKKEGIDLENELKIFNTADKRAKLENKSLASTLEYEIKERVLKESEKKDKK